MKILYISAEHVSGTLSLFQAEHRWRGDECRFVTFWHSRWDFPDDICLDLPLMPDKSWVLLARKAARLLRGPAHSASPSATCPYWTPSPPERALFAWRDRLLWPKMEAAIQAHGLDRFDIVHLDGGLDFTRDARFASSMRSRGKHIVCYYHGSDLRNRGIVPAVDTLAELRLTPEWDLLELDPRLQYLYLPFETDRYPRRDYHFHSPVRVCHATRNPYKGTEFVERAMEELSKKYPVELVLLRGLPHAEALRRKQECDIFVDQLTNAGGWGYGMSSVEAFSMGMPVITNIPAKMAAHLGEHPFVHAGTDTVRDALEDLITHEDKCRALAVAGREWVQRMHDVRSVGDQLYRYYEAAGWLNRS
ncbi:MAG TPA: glycosyltransferase [bacterium]|jgi:glycosyltransferase involved in cell wall biosynthesis